VNIDRCRVQKLQLFTGVNLLQNCGGGAVECWSTRIELPTRVGSEEGVSPSPVGPGKIVRFYPSKCWTFMVYWTLDQGHSTATVIMLFMPDWHRTSVPLPYRLVLPIFHCCIIMLLNVASTPFSCDRLLPSLFSVHNLTTWLSPSHPILLQTRGLVMLCCALLCA